MTIPCFLASDRHDGGCSNERKGKLMPILGTFLKDGDCLTGIIRTSTTQARLTFTPDSDGILIASIDGQPVGHAEPRPSGDGINCFVVYLRPEVLPEAPFAALVAKGCVFVLTTCR